MYSQSQSQPELSIPQSQSTFLPFDLLEPCVLELKQYNSSQFTTLGDIDGDHMKMEESQALGIIASNDFFLGVWKQGVQRHKNQSFSSLPSIFPFFFTSCCDCDLFVAYTVGNCSLKYNKVEIIVVTINCYQKLRKKGVGG